MIYSVTFNPALDVSGVVDQLIPNEKCYVHDEVHTPGGNGINAGIIAHRLKSKVILSGFLGGTNGDEIMKLLDKEKINHQFVKILGNTRMNITVSNKLDHLQTRLSFPGPSLLKKEIKKLEIFLREANSGDVVVLGGSFTPSLSTSIVLEMIQGFRKNNVRCLVDMPGKFLKDIINAKPNFIKPNLLEFQILAGQKVDTIKEVLPIAQKLLSDIPLICISSIEGGALLIDQHEACFGKIPPVKIYSTVGAGDSMVGAFASVWQRDPDASLESLLRLGLSAACATLTERGLTLGSRTSILKYQPQIDIIKI